MCKCEVERESHWIQYNPRKKNFCRKEESAFSIQHFPLDIFCGRRSSPVFHVGACIAVDRHSTTKWSNTEQNGDEQTKENAICFCNFWRRWMKRAESESDARWRWRTCKTEKGEKRRRQKSNLSTCSLCALCYLFVESTRCLFISFLRWFAGYVHWMNEEAFQVEALLWMNAWYIVLLMAHEPEKGMLKLFSLFSTWKLSLLDRRLFKNGISWLHSSFVFALFCTSRCRSTVQKGWGYLEDKLNANTWEIK